MNNESLAEKALLRVVSTGGGGRGAVVVAVRIRIVILFKITVEGWKSRRWGFPGTFLFEDICVFFNRVLVLLPLPILLFILSTAGPLNTLVLP